jgi:AcrR family transcriptional regulator
MTTSPPTPPATHTPTAAALATTASAGTEPASRSWRGVPLEVRRAERRAQLIAAAFELLGTEGWRGTTVRGVCQTARLNPRYFYESFDTLETLLIAVFDELVVESTQVGLRAVEEAGPHPTDRTVAVIRAFVRYVTDDPRRARILFIEAQGNERLGRRRLDTMHATATFVERNAWRQTGVADDRIGMIASHLLVGGLTELVVTWLDGHLDISLDRLIEDVADLLVAVGSGAVAVARARRPIEVPSPG